ncbi:hypothetical protein Tco_1309684 [Tanacetum coccineum]
MTNAISALMWAPGHFKKTAPVEGIRTKGNGNTVPRLCMGVAGHKQRTNNVVTGRLLLDRSTYVRLSPIREFEKKTSRRLPWHLEQKKLETDSYGWEPMPHGKEFGYLFMAIADCDHARISQIEVFYPCQHVLACAKFKAEHQDNRVCWYQPKILNGSGQYHDGVCHKAPKSITRGEVHLTGPEIVKNDVRKSFKLRQRMPELLVIGPKELNANLKRKPMEFEVGDKVMSQVSLGKRVVRFWQTRKLNPSSTGTLREVQSFYVEREDQSAEIPPTVLKTGRRQVP